MNVSPIDVSVIAIYLIGITAFGIWIGFRKHTSSHQYFLANKSLGWFTVGAAVFTSNISTLHLVGLAAGGAKDGMVIGNFEWMACVTLIALALVFAPFYINSGVSTLPEFMERRYCPQARTFLAIIGLLGALLIHIGICLFAAASMAAALMSCMAAALNSCATLISLDIIKRLHSETPDKRVVAIGRIATGVIMVLAMLGPPRATSSARSSKPSTRFP